MPDNHHPTQAQAENASLRPFLLASTPTQNIINENAREKENLHHSPAHVAKSRAPVEGESVRRRLPFDDTVSSVYSANESTSQHIPQSARTEFSFLESSSSLSKGAVQSNVYDTRRKNDELVMKSRKGDSVLKNNNNRNFLWVNDKLRINIAERENVQLELNYKPLVNQSFVAHAEIYNEFALFLKVEVPAKLPMHTEINKVNKISHNEGNVNNERSVDSSQMRHEPHIFFREKKSKGSSATKNNYTEHVLCISFDATDELFKLENKLATATNTKDKELKGVDKILKTYKQQTQAAKKNKKQAVGAPESEYEQEQLADNDATSERQYVCYCDNLPLLNFKITFSAERIPARLPSEDELYLIVTNYCAAHNLKINELDIDVIYDKLVKPNFKELDRALWNEESEVRLNLWSSIRRLCIENYVNNLDDNDDPYEDIPHEITFIQRY